jgi:membrane protease YdiL (CAAX protease family)
MRTWDISLRSTLLLVVSAPVLGIFANLVAALGPLFVPELQSMAEQYRAMTNELFPKDDPLLWAAGAASVVIAAPFCEEFLFRGTLQPLQERAHRSAWLIVVANGVLFGAIHFNPLSLVALSIVGAFLADVTLRTRSLWPAVMGHAVLNLFNGLILPEVAGKYADPAVQPDAGEVGWGIALVAPVAIGLWMLLRRSLDADASG